MKKAILILATVIVLCGCSNKEEVPTWESYTNLRMDVKKGTFIQDSNLKNPGALLAAKDTLYVVSQEEHCVFCYNYDGELTNQFGSMGSGKGEFNTPVAIAGDEHFVYVVNENDGRIQCFDYDGNYQKEIYIDKLDNISVRVLDIESDNVNLYISAGSYDKSRIGLYLVDQDGSVKRIGKSEMGCFGKNEKTNEVYFANAYEYFEEDNMFGYESGGSYLSKVNGHNLEKMFLLPEGYLPAGLHIEDEKIYIFSEAIMEVDAFDYSGNYIETLFTEAAEMENRGVTHMAIRDEVVFLSDTENNLIYKIGMNK